MQSSREHGPMSPKDRWPRASCFRRVSFINAKQDILGLEQTTPREKLMLRTSSTSSTGSRGSGEMTNVGLETVPASAADVIMHPMNVVMVLFCEADFKWEATSVWVRLRKC